AGFDLNHIVGYIAPRLDGPERRKVAAGRAPVHNRQAMDNPYAPPQAAVRDIVDPAAGLVLADRGARLGAAILDALIFGGMVYTPVVISAVMAGAAQAGRAEPDRSGMGVGGLVALGMLFVWVVI